MNNEFDDFIDYLYDLNLTNSERRTLIEYINNLLSQIAALSDSRNAWKVRAETAERNLEAILNK